MILSSRELRRWLAGVAVCATGNKVVRTDGVRWILRLGEIMIESLGRPGSTKRTNAIRRELEQCVVTAPHGALRRD